MPKYSTVQAYSDNSSNVQTVSYEQASGSAASKGPVRPEKVVNPYGSTAGANSGDFHLYRQTRAREMERIKALTTAEKERLLDAEFQQEQEQNRQVEEERTAKKRKKRQRQKEAKLRRKMLAKAGVKLDNHHDNDDDDEGDFDEDDFAVPEPEKEEVTAKQEEDVINKDDATWTEPNDAPIISDKPPIAPPFPNDGSFLEMMKKQLEARQAENEL